MSGSANKGGGADAQDNKIVLCSNASRRRTTNVVKTTENYSKTQSETDKQM